LGIVKNFFSLEFEERRKTIENNSLALYVQDAGKRTISSEESVVRYYLNCHRSVVGHDPRLLETKDRKRLMKSMSSNKIRAACPSTTIVTKSSNYINVRYYPLHVGHDFHVCNISKEDVDIIAG